MEIYKLQNQDTQQTLIFTELRTHTHFMKAGRDVSAARLVMEVLHQEDLEINRMSPVRNLRAAC